MAVGGCFCGKVRIEYSGQPLASVSTAHRILSRIRFCSCQPKLTLFPRHCAIVSIVANLPGQPIATISSSKVTHCKSLEVRKKWQKHRIVETLSRIISVLTVVCIELNFPRLGKQHLTKSDRHAAFWTQDTIQWRLCRDYSCPGWNI